MAAPFKISSYLPGVVALVIAAIACVFAANTAVTRIEAQAQGDVARELVDAGLTWSRVDVDGLQVKLSGTAPDEATRFRALRIAGAQVDAARIVDAMGVQDPDATPPPRFSMEILRNDDGISLIGLIPADADRDAYLESASDAADNIPVTDLLQTSNHPVPEGWHQAINFAMAALADLPRAKISASAGGVEVTAMASSEEARREFETALRRVAPDAVPVTLSISAPRPVITPFTLRFLIEEGQARFDACAADTDAAADLIVKAARRAGLPKDVTCPIGLGTPSTSWGAAAERAIDAVAQLGAGSVTFSDGDVTIVGTQTLDANAFDRVVAALDADLPDLFTLHSVLPRPVVETQTQGEGLQEFTAVLHDDGTAEIRGGVGNELTLSAVESFAHVEFGVENVLSAIRIDNTLPQGWPVRVLSGLEALSLLNSGTLRVLPASLALTGQTGSQATSAQAAQILSEKLGEGQDYDLDIRYVEALDPFAALPTPEECIVLLNDILAEKKITFAPSSSEIEQEALATIDRITEVLPDCRLVEMEIGGHTDSQGREIMNLSLSQARADAVLNAIMSRRILTANLTAKGYGETQPIAENDTEAGREANRRIEFTLRVLEETVAEADVPQDAPQDAPETVEAAETEPTPTVPQDLEQGGAGPAIQTDVGGLEAPQEDNGDE
ncbi:MAG: OmpA family protein [Pseudomonadota bacterium]